MSFSKKRQLSDCLKQARNWSGRTENIRFDSNLYNQTTAYNNEVITDIDVKTIYTKNNLAIYSPKLFALAKNIYDLDMRDLKEHKHTFKHFIFSNTSKLFGAILIASALQKMLGLKPIMTEGEDNLVHVGEGGKHHYGLLTPNMIMKRNYEPGFKEKLLKKFNTSENVNGKHMRFIILDSAYKEGIDLANVKYVHLFEPLPTYAQEKQAVARAIRFCSHKDMPYEEEEGWKVDVYVYKLMTKKGENVQVYDPKTEKYEEMSNVNIDELIYKMDMEKRDEYVSTMMNLLEASAAALSVDFKLTKNLIPKPILDRLGEENVKAQVDALYDSELAEGSIASYVSDTYKRSAIRPPPKVNNCLYEEKYLNDYQKFLALFFASEDSKLGMLLWHSPGSGKTCTALNMAHKLQQNGYTVCWATNLSLGKKRTDCNLTGTNLVIPAYVSRNRIDKTAAKEPGWLGETYSYKGLINIMNSGTYDNHVVIFDEAHLLFSNDLPEQERMSDQNLADLRRNFERSWTKKKKGSPLRVIFLTGTPLTSPINFFKLLNIIRDVGQPPFPETLEDMQSRYPLGSDMSVLRAELDGYISYLDTRSDTSRFARHGDLIPYEVEMSVRDDTSEDAQMKMLAKQMKSAETRMETMLKKYANPKNATKKESLKDQFLALGQEYFQKKNELTRTKQNRFTRKASQDYSQQTAFEKCGFFPRKADKDGFIEGEGEGEDEGEDLEPEGEK